MKIFHMNKEGENTMKSRMFILVVIGAALVILGCDKETAESPEITEAEVMTLAKPAFSNVYTFAGDLVGSATLNRNKNGIRMTLQTTGIDAGTAVTVWYVIFNEPSECGSSPCGEADIFDPDVQTGVVYAAGHVIGGGGNSNFAGHRSVSDASVSAMPFFNELLGLNLPVVGLLDPFGAEVHLVVRTHEEAIPEFLPDMIQTFNGGCTYPAGVTPGIAGVPGPNTGCEDIQFAIFQP
jgi:hypothetical protein